MVHRGADADVGQLSRCRRVARPVSRRRRPDGRVRVPALLARLHGALPARRRALRRRRGPHRHVLGARRRPVVVRPSAARPSRCARRRRSARHVRAHHRHDRVAAQPPARAARCGRARLGGAVAPGRSARWASVGGPRRDRRRRAHASVASRLVGVPRRRVVRVRRPPHHAAGSARPVRRRRHRRVGGPSVRTVAPRRCRGRGGVGGRVGLGVGDQVVDRRRGARCRAGAGGRDGGDRRPSRRGSGLRRPRCGQLAGPRRRHLARPSAHGGGPRRRRDRRGRHHLAARSCRAPGAMARAAGARCAGGDPPRVVRGAPQPHAGAPGLHPPLDGGRRRDRPVRPARPAGSPSRRRRFSVARATAPRRRSSSGRVRRRARPP